MANTFITAQQYAADGLSLFPVRADGSKAPALPSWKMYQSRRPSEAELHQWFSDARPRGIALVNGAISGNLETLDFDELGLYDRYEKLLQEQGIGELLECLPLVETPSGGRHLLYHCTEPVTGSQKLAQRKTGPGLETLIETRGEGGYILAPGSALSCHPTRKPYQFLRGGVASIGTITSSERHMLLNLAALFNEYVEPQCIQDAPSPRTNSNGLLNGLKPGDDYNAREDYRALLVRHGWRHLRDAAGKGLWQRPGKPGPGLSATSNYADCGLFYVFSANAAPFDPQTAYSPFAVYALLEHGGDYSKAARTLVAEGYGDQSHKPHEADPPKTSALASSPIVPAGPPIAPATRKPLVDRIIDLADVEPPGELPLLFGKYLLKGHQHWLTGQTGIGKSTLIYNLATALAEGTDLWSIPCEPQTVLYLDTESGDVGRAVKVDRLYQGSLRVRNRLLFVREPVRLPEELPELLAFIQERGVSLVIFDTARRCFSVRDENDNAEVYNRVVPTLDALKLAGVASLTMGHPSKNGGSGARGAGAQEDAGDVNLTLTMHRGEVRDKDGVIALQVTKNRLLGMGIPPLYLRRSGEDHFQPLEEAEAGPGPKPISALLQCRDVVLSLLKANANGQATFAALLEAAKEAGLTKTTLHRTLTEMESQEEVTHPSRGGYCLFDPFAE